MNAARYTIGQRVRYVDGNVDYLVIGVHPQRNILGQFGEYVYGVRPYKNGHNGDARGARECELVAVGRD